MNNIVYHAMFSYRHSPSKAALKASGTGGGEAMEWMGGVCLHVEGWAAETSKEVLLESKRPVRRDLPFKPQIWTRAWCRFRCSWQTLVLQPILNTWATQITARVGTQNYLTATDRVPITSPYCLLPPQRTTHWQQVCWYKGDSHISLSVLLNESSKNNPTGPLMVKLFGLWLAVNVFIVH